VAIATARRAACAFGYRDSVFKREGERWVVSQSSCDCRSDNAVDTLHPEELAAMHIDTPRAAHVAEAVHTPAYAQDANPR